MYTFANERYLATLLVDELNAAIAVLNKPSGPSETEVKMIASTFVAGLTVWWDLNWKMQKLADIEEWRADRG